MFRLRRVSSRLEASFPDAKEGVQVSMMALALTAEFGRLDVSVTCLSQGIDFDSRRYIAPERLHEIHALLRHRENSFCASVLEGLCHSGLVRRFDAAVESIVSGLESHLNEGIGTDSHGRDKVFAVTSKLEDLDLVLEDEIGEAGFGEADTGGEFGGENPFDFVGCGIDVTKRLWISFRWVGRIGSPERWSGGVDTSCEPQNRVGVDIRRKSQDCMTVHTRIYMLADILARRLRSKLIPALPFLHTIIWILSYHRFVHVPV